MNIIGTTVQHGTTHYLVQVTLKFALFEVVQHSAVEVFL